MSPTPTGDLRTCDLCAAEVEKAELVYSYRINVHRFDFGDGCEQTGQFCPGCAEVEAARLRWGSPDEAMMPVLDEWAAREFGGPVEVRWMQGDTHKILIHVRRR